MQTQLCALLAWRVNNVTCWLSDCCHSWLPNGALNTGAAVGNGCACVCGPLSGAAVMPMLVGDGVLSISALAFAAAVSGVNVGLFT